MHVYRDGELVVKWDLDNRRAMKGMASRRVLRLIANLESEGLLPRANARGSIEL